MNSSPVKVKRFQMGVIIFYFIGMIFQELIVVFALVLDTLGKEHRVASPSGLLMARARSRSFQSRAAAAAALELLSVFVIVTCDFYF